MIDALLTVPEVSKAIKFSEEHVRRLLRKGILIGTKFGSDWRVKDSDLKLYVDSQKDNSEK